MNVKELQDALCVLESAYAAGGAGKQAQEIGKLVAALSGREDQSVEDFARDALLKLNGAAAGRTTSATTPDQSVVVRHVAELFSAGTDRSAFDRAFGAMKSDKAAKLAEIVEIANRYVNQPTGGQSRFRFDTKTAAFDFILSTYMSRAVTESRLEVIGHMTKWGSH